MPKKYFIKTYGCQMNVSDSERMAGVLEKIGYRPAAKMEEADLAVFVACSVRQSAMDRVYGQIRQLGKIKTPPRRGGKNAKRKTILTGCLLERDKQELSKIFDLIFDIKDLPKLPKLIAPAKKSRPIAQRLPPKRDPAAAVTTPNAAYFRLPPSRQSQFSAYVPIMTGCDNYCSYCVVPYARGREISRSPGEIIREVKNLIRAGYREIILLGQNVNSYQGQGKIADFPDLLAAINALPGNFWIRFLTSHPKDMSVKLIRAIAAGGKICEYVHLPVQSGDDAILKKMNRRYTAGHYRELLEKIRRQIPGVAISTDLIVGFPGETKRQFAHTAKLMREMKFDMAYTAQYSPRRQTAAYQLEDDVPREEKKRREKILTEILEKTALENNRKYIGKIANVLLDKKLPARRSLPSATSAKESPLIAYGGQTRAGKNVKITLTPASRIAMPKIGDFIKVKITGATAWNLAGTVKQKGSSRTSGA